MLSLVRTSHNSEHFNRKNHRMDLPRDLFLGIYKRVVRVAYASGTSLLESKRLALTLLPWFPEYYDSIRGIGAASARVGTLESPGYYGSGKTRTLDRYKTENRSRLSPNTLAETLVAEYIIRNGQPVTKEEITPLLTMQNDRQSAIAKRSTLLASNEYDYLYIFKYNNAASPESKIGFTRDPRRRESELQTAANGDMHCHFRLPIGVSAQIESALKAFLREFSSGQKTEIFSWHHEHLKTLVEVYLTANSYQIDLVIY